MKTRELAETVIKVIRKPLLKMISTNGKIARVGRYNYQKLKINKILLTMLYVAVILSAEKNDLFKLILNEINPTMG